MPEFVGRVHELEQLHVHLDLAKIGQSRLVLLEGEAGMGKSRLLRAFTGRLTGVSVVHASGDETESQLGGGVLDQILDRARRLTGEPSARQSTGAPGDPLIQGAELLGTLGRLEARGPVLIVVDDAQWADRLSLQSLSFAFRRLHADPVLGIVAIRDSAMLPDGLRRLAAQRGAVIRVEGLGSAELGELARRLGVGPLPHRSLRRLHEHTGGNPLYARALMEELPTETLVRVDGALPAPRSLATLLQARLAGLSDDARHLVEAASILGLRSDLGLMTRVAEVAEPTGALDEAARASLLEIMAEPTAVMVGFPNALVRAAVRDSLGPARRAALHERAGRILAGRQSLHHRAAAAMVPNAGLAAELAAQADTDAGRGDLSSAGRSLLAAARLDPDPERRERHVLDAVDRLLDAGEVIEAMARQQDLLALTDNPRRGYVLGHLALAAGRHGEAEALLASAWSAADPLQEADVRASACAQLAWVRVLQFRPHEAIAWSRRALETGAAPRVADTAVTTLVSSLALVGRSAEAMALVESLGGERGAATGGDTAGWLGRGILHLWAGDLEQAESDLSSALRATDRAPASFTGLLAMAFLAQAEYLQGRWTETVQHAELAVALASDSGQVCLLPVMHATAAWALGARGEWDEAEDHVEAANEAATRLGEPASMAYADAADAHVAFCRSDPERLVKAGQRLEQHGGREVLDVPAVLPWRELYADALVRLGRLDEAAPAVQSLEKTLAARRSRPLAWASAARVRGNLEAAFGNEVAARAAFERGLAYPGTEAAPFERALLVDAYGRFLRRSGERREAAGRLRSAWEGFAAVGARPFLEAVERELAACGVSGGRRSASAHMQLTPQEMAVAQLVAEGRTNRDVSEALILSHKTVEYHLANIFTKLGIHSRRDLAARLKNS